MRGSNSEKADSSQQQQESRPDGRISALYKPQWREVDPHAWRSHPHGTLLNTTSVT